MFDSSYQWFYFILVHVDNSTSIESRKREDKKFLNWESYYGTAQNFFYFTLAKEDWRLVLPPLHGSKDIAKEKWISGWNDGFLPPNSSNGSPIYVETNAD